MPNFKVRELTPEEQVYVRAHCHNTTVIKLAEHLRVRKGSIFLFLEREGITPFRTGRGGRKRLLRFNAPEEVTFNVHERDWITGLSTYWDGTSEKPLQVKARLALAPAVQRQFRASLNTVYER